MFIQNISLILRTKLAIERRFTICILTKTCLINLSSLNIYKD